MPQVIRTIIVDDEPLVRERLRDMLAMDRQFHLVAECINGLEAVVAIERHQPQLLFLDIQMPPPNGFEVLEQIEATLQPITIFVTAYDQYAVKAFEYEALDYLLKPFDTERFQKAINRARQRLAERQSLQNNGLDYLLAKSQQQIHKINPSDILWLQANRNYVRVHLRDNIFQLRSTISRLETKLNPQQFYRIHRSTIINIQAIKSFKHLYQGEYLLELKNGKKLTSSKSYRDTVLTLLKRVPK